MNLTGGAQGEKKNLDRTGFEHSFHHISVAPQHPRVVDPEPEVEQLTHLLIPRLSDFPSENPVTGVVFTAEVVQTTFDRGRFF